MSIVAVGSLAFDSITSTEGSRERILGGSLTHFSNAAAFLSKPQLVGVVGNDFSETEWEFLRGKTSSLDGVETMENEKSFFWKGYYTKDVNNAITQATELNAFAKFKPVVPESYKQDDYTLFLANIDPVVQLDVVHQCSQAKFKVLDTMNYWISNAPEKLHEVFETVDCIIINETEAYSLSDEINLIAAAEKLFFPNFKMIILKKGSNGVMVFGKKYMISLPSFPIDHVIDPTGAGDSFAGAFFSYIDKYQVDVNDREQTKKAAIYATIVASFAVEGFGVEGIDRINEDDINRRLKLYSEISGFQIP